jgi:ABC-2 type transporter
MLQATASGVDRFKQCNQANRSKTAGTAQSAPSSTLRSATESGLISLNTSGADDVDAGSPTTAGIGQATPHQVRQTVARTMPQLGLLYMLVYLPMNMLSGGNTPLESMPIWLARMMQVSPSTHFVAFAQSILYRGAGLDVVWPQFLAVAVIGAVFFGLAIVRFRSVTAQAA